MSKTVKHCDVCNENFGDRFSFCPVCGETLKAVGVGEPEAFAAPVGGNVVAATGSEQREEKIAVATTASLAGEGAPFVQSEPRSANGSANFKTNGATENGFADNVYTRPAPQTDSDAIENFEIDAAGFHNDGLYHLTILQSGRERRLNLMNGAMVGLLLLLTIGTGYWVWELFRFPLDISAIDQETGISYAYLNTADPMEVEEEKPESNKKDSDGGGGGGGKKDPEVQKGVMPQMRREKQEIAPDVERVIKPNFELKQAATLEGPPQPVKPTWEQYGVVNGSKNVGGGTGEGRGLGNGRGSGIGTGNGTGYGSGNGSGIGSGNGNGIGNGSGLSDGEPPPVKPRTPPVTTPLQILSKPSPKFTEEARKQNIKGTVLLRVTFSASGQVTGISPVRGLGGGLTEQAIAAARLIQFKPMLKNGTPVSVVKTIEYNFNMY